MVHIPVVADYDGLERLVEKALKTLETSPMKMRGVGDITAEFGRVHIHETSNGHIAIGLELAAATSRQWLKPRGTVWMTARPVLRPGSQQLEVDEVVITGTPANASFAALLAVARSQLVRDQIGRALSRDFTAERTQVLAAAMAALSSRRMGDFRLAAKIETLDHGALQVTGQGIALPIRATGSAIMQLDQVMP